MAEHGLNETVIGLAMDGGGYGVDDTVWGGEFLLVQPDRFERPGFFETLPMPGGGQAVREPWRMALSYLYKSYGEEFWHLPLAFLEDADQTSWPLFRKMIDRQLNSPLTSSLGRFFDAVSAVLTVCYENTYSGQAAIELEMLAEGGEDIPYEFMINKNGASALVVDQIMVFKQIVQACIEKVPSSQIAFRFHVTLAHIFNEMCKKIQGVYGINKVCLAGGVFQNRLLLERTVDLLSVNGFEVFWSEETPVNDGGISLGQAWIASNMLREAAKCV